MARHTAGSAADAQRVRHEEDTWNRNFLRRFYEARSQQILQSGDEVRIRLYQQWLAREAQKEACV